MSYKHLWVCCAVLWVLNWVQLGLIIFIPELLSLLTFPRFGSGATSFPHIPCCSFSQCYERINIGDVSVFLLIYSSYEIK